MAEGNWSIIEQPVPPRENEATSQTIKTLWPDGGQV